ESSERDRTVLEALGQISETTRSHLELSADEAEPRFDAMWATIERRVTANGKADELAAPATRSHRAQAEPGGVLAALGRWFTEQRGHLLTGTLAAGAAAAIMFFALPRDGGDHRSEQAGARNPIVTTPVNNGATPCVPTPRVPAVSQPAAVEELSVTGGTGYILTIPGEDGENDTTVIWIEPEDKLESPI
ncbi:MAG TPA: hypothetical protein VML75_26075, partial [Kofleriaceae bacterium]|nr:hypothetical protein [Kofleriaceae bacterium]